MALGTPCGCGRITHDRDLEALLDELTHLCLDAELGRHPGEAELIDASHKQLQHEVVRCGAEHPVGARHDGRAVYAGGLVALEPVGARAVEALEAEGWRRANMSIACGALRARRYGGFESAWCYAHVLFADARAVVLKRATIYNESARLSVAKIYLVCGQ